MKKGLSLTLSILGFFILLFAFSNNFKKVKLLYVVYFKQSCFKKEVLVLERYYTVDGEPTDLYHIEGYLKKNKIKKIITGYLPSLDKDEEGNYLVWYCNSFNENFIIKRKKYQNAPSKLRVNAWFNFILMILFFPSLGYYIRLKILEKNKK